MKPGYTDSVRGPTIIDVGKAIEELERIERRERELLELDRVLEEVHRELDKVCARVVVYRRVGDLTLTEKGMNYVKEEER